MQYVRRFLRSQDIKGVFEMKKVLSIAGSDSGGGAGIQADLKTFAAYRVHGMTAITAVTAQNTRGVSDIQGVNPDIIKAQIKAVVEDIGVDAVKIGMLHSSQVIEAVAEMISHYKLPHVVLDPVMVSTSGSELLEPSAKKSIIEQLLPLSSVLTPNIHEAEILGESSIGSVEDAKRVAEKISKHGPKAVLIKGGHLGDPDKATDILYAKGKHLVLESKRHETRNTHGTGCSLSSAIAAELAQGKTVEEAVKGAKKFVNKGIKAGIDIGDGPGPVNPMVSLYDEADKIKVLDNIREAVRLVESEPLIRKLVAECQMNIGMALPHADDAGDVAAVDGRLTKHMDGVRAQGSPRFDASRHIAHTILAVREFDTSKRAGMNLIYKPEIVEALKELGLVVSYYDRREEPEEYKDIEGMTTKWGSAEAVKRAGRTPDVIYHLGDWGKEPMIVLLGESAVEVASWSVEVARGLK